MLATSSSRKKRVKKFLTSDDESEEMPEQGESDEDTPSVDDNDEDDDEDEESLAYKLRVPPTRTSLPRTSKGKPLKFGLPPLSDDEGAQSDESDVYTPSPLQKPTERALARRSQQ